MGPAGPAGLVWRGTWSPSGAYVTHDAVYYHGSGSSYVANANNTADTPPGASWSLLASIGATSPSQNANQVVYDHSNSALSDTNVQRAIDSVAASVAGLQAAQYTDAQAVNAVTAAYSSKIYQVKVTQAASSCNPANVFATCTNNDLAIGGGCSNPADQWYFRDVQLYDAHTFYCRAGKRWPTSTMRSTRMRTSGFERKKTPSMGALARIGSSRGPRAPGRSSGRSARSSSTR